MKQDIIKLLGLQNIWVDSWEIKEKEITVKARSPRTHCMCPHCALSTKKVHQYKQRKIKHSIWQDREVILKLTQRRFYCKKCQKAFMEHIPGIDKRRTTSNFRGILLKNLAGNSLSRARSVTKASSSVLYSALKENHDKLKEINWEEQGKKFVLGIDEHSFRGKRMALTLTNITKKKLIAVLKNDKKETLKRFLKNADQKRIFEVCIDMRIGFLNAVLEEMPKVKITIDKFHVITHANKVLDEVRSIIVDKGYHVRRTLFKGREKLSEKEKVKLKNLFEKFDRFPALYEAYLVKEKIRSFYRLKDRKEAKRQLKLIIMFCENSNSKFIEDLGKTLVRWKEYILNYFDNYSTNAFTEGVHTKIKMIKRMSFGFRNIDNYITKITLAFLPFLWFSYHTF